MLRSHRDKGVTQGFWCAILSWGAIIEPEAKPGTWSYTTWKCLRSYTSQGGKGKPGSKRDPGWAGAEAMGSRHI